VLLLSASVRIGPAPPEEYSRLLRGVASPRHASLNSSTNSSIQRSPPRRNPTRLCPFRSDAVRNLSESVTLPVAGKAYGTGGRYSGHCRNPELFVISRQSQRKVNYWSRVDGVHVSRHLSACKEESYTGDRARSNSPLYNGCKYVCDSGFRQNCESTGLVKVHWLRTDTRVLGGDSTSTYDQQ